MNKWFKLALFAFVAIIAINLISSLFVRPMGYNNYGGHMNNGYYYNNGHMMQQQMPMHNGMKR